MVMKPAALKLDMPGMRYSIRGRGDSRMLCAVPTACPDHGGGSPGTAGAQALGRYHGKLTVTSGKGAVFSTLRGKVDEMGGRAGAKLDFVIISVEESARSVVTISCYVYDPSSRGQAEFGAFKKE